MPTLVIPADVPHLPVEDYFNSRHFPYDVSVLAEYVSATPGALTVGSTDGYLEADTGGWGAYSRGVGFDVRDAVAIGAKVAPTVIALDRTTVTAMRAVVMAQVAVGDSYEIQVSGNIEGAGGWTESSPIVPITGNGWVRIENPARSALWGSDLLWDLFVGDAADGNLAIVSALTGEQTGVGVVRVAWMALEIDYTEAVLPVLRVFPRRDGRGMSSARAVWPPSKTVQDKHWLPFGGGYR